MKNCKNECINCSVETCKYHSDDKNCCTRNGIEVGSCGNCSAETSEKTFCQSFENKSGF